MISITLTGDEAIAYIATSNPDIKQMEETIQTATEYITALEDQLKMLGDPKELTLENLYTNIDDPLRHNIGGAMNRPAHHQEEQSNRVLRDSIIAKELEPNLAMANTKWTKGELGIIYWAMDRPEDELNRRVDNLYKKITRTEGAIRSKLNDLGIEVTDGVMHYIKD